MLGSRPLTVLHLLPALDGGGVETDVAALSGALVAAGHRSIVVSGGGRLAAKITAEGGTHLQWPVGKKSPAALLCIPKLRRLIRAERVDILHTHSRVPAWLAWLAWQGMKAAEKPRFVTTVHGLNSPGLYSGVMLRSERVIAVSNTVRAYLAKHYPQADLSKITVIARGVDPALFPFGFQPPPEWLAAWRAQYPALAGRFVFTLAGRLTRLKGHQEALLALETVLAAGVDAHLLLVGGEDPRRAAYAAELRQAVAQKKLGDRVTFTGHRADIREVLSVSSAVVSCSTKPETFGLSVLEAIRLGVPVVGYDHGGVGEVLAEVYPQGRVRFADLAWERAAGMADKLIALARGGMERPKPGTQFPLSETVGRTLELYGELAK